MFNALVEAAFWMPAIQHSMLHLRFDLCNIVLADLLCALTTAVRDLQVADDLIDETFEEQGVRSTIPACNMVAGCTG